MHKNGFEFTKNYQFKDLANYSKRKLKISSIIFVCLLLVLMNLYV